MAFWGVRERLEHEAFYIAWGVRAPRGKGQLRQQFGGALEHDETTFGRTRHGKGDWDAAGKAVVFGVVERNGHVTAMPIAAHSKLW